MRNIQNFGNVVYEIRLIITSRRIETGRRHLMIAFFDLLYLNNEDFTCRTFGERRKVLESTIRFIPNWVHADLIKYYSVEIKSKRNMNRLSYVKRENSQFHEVKSL